VPYLFVDQHVNEVLLGVSLLVRGAGLGGLIIPLNASAYQELSKDAVPGATSAINIVLRVGASFGTAILAVILQHELTSHAASTDGQLTAFGNTFFWTLILTAAALIPAFFLPTKQAAAKAAGTPAAPATGQQPAAK